MHLDERVRGQVPVGLVGMDTRVARPYCMPVHCTRRSVSSNTFVSWRRPRELSHIALENTETPPLNRSRGETSEKTSFGLLRESTEDKDKASCLSSLTTATSSSHSPSTVVIILITTVLELYLNVTSHGQTRSSACGGRVLQRQIPDGLDHNATRATVSKPMTHLNMYTSWPHCHAPCTSTQFRRETAPEEKRRMQSFRLWGDGMILNPLTPLQTWTESISRQKR
jgi:hypothetical protein